jgi:hypothetical protein
MEKSTKIFIFNMFVLAALALFVLNGKDGWAVFMAFLLFYDKN